MDTFFFSVGDRGNRDDAQDLGKANGKIMRLLLDGSTPSDNPFINQKGSLSTIWSYGHRNPQGLFYDLGSKKLYSNEHGPKGGDEINLIEKGKNYGWPVITFGREYYGPKVGKGLTKSAGMEQPLYYFTPSIAPSSLSIYKGNQFPEFQGAFLAGALVLQHINIAQENDSKWKETRILLELSERIRNVLVRDGDIYFSTDSGKLMKIIN